MTGRGDLDPHGYAERVARYLELIQNSTLAAEEDKEAPRGVSEVLSALSIIPKHPLVLLVRPKEIEDFDNLRRSVRVDNRIGKPRLTSDSVPEEVVDSKPGVLLWPEARSIGMWYEAKTAFANVNMQDGITN